MAGTKRHAVVDGEGTPLGLTVGGANRHDSRMLAPTLDAVPPVGGQRGRPRRRPHKLHAYKGDDYRRCRRECRVCGIVPRIAWLAQFHRLAVRHDRRANVHLALTTLGMAVVCMRQIRRFCP